MTREIAGVGHDHRALDETRPILIISSTMKPDLPKLILLTLHNGTFSMTREIAGVRQDHWTLDETRPILVTSTMKT